MLILLPFLGNSQQVSNIVSGYIPEINRIEVYFDLDSSKENENYSYKLYLYNLDSKEYIKIGHNSIYGLDFNNIKPGIQIYFQVDLKDIKLKNEEYSLIFSNDDIENEINNPIVNEEVDSVKLEPKKDNILSKINLNQLKSGYKPFSKKEYKTNLYKNFNYNLITVGVNPFDLSGEQSSKSLNLQFSKIFGIYGVGLSLKYGTGKNIFSNLLTDNENILNYNNQNQNYFFNGDFITKRFSLIPSFIYRANNKLVFSFGIGFGNRDLFWGIDEFNINDFNVRSKNWAKNILASPKGVEIEGGVKYLINRFNIHLGINYLGLKKSNKENYFSDLWLGIGFNF